MRYISFFFFFFFSSITLFAQIRNVELPDDFFPDHVGEKYAEFRKMSVDKQSVTSEMLQGKVTLINFWFEGCTPCMAELNELLKLYEELKPNPDFQFISFTLDDADAAAEFVKKYRISYPVCSISRDECNRLNYQSGFPAHIIVDRAGKICFFESGGAIDTEIVRIQVEHFKEELIKFLSD